MKIANKFALACVGALSLTVSAITGRMTVSMSPVEISMRLRCRNATSPEGDNSTA